MTHSWNKISWDKVELSWCICIKSKSVVRHIMRKTWVVYPNKILTYRWSRVTICLNVNTTVIALMNQTAVPRLGRKISCRQKNTELKFWCVISAKSCNITDCCIVSVYGHMMHIGRMMECTIPHPIYFWIITQIYWRINRRQQWGHQLNGLWCVHQSSLLR